VILSALETCIEVGYDVAFIVRFTKEALAWTENGINLKKFKILRIKIFIFLLCYTVGIFLEEWNDVEECVLHILMFCGLGRILSFDHDELISCLSLEWQSSINSDCFLRRVGKVIGTNAY